MRHSLSFFSCLVACLLAAPAFATPSLLAPNAQDLSGTRAMAMGDAFRAVASSNEAIYFNLAGMAQARKYEMDLAYAFDRGNDLSRFNGSIVDSKTTTFGTGLAYTRLTGSGIDGEASGSIVNLGFGVPLGERTAFGFGFKYLGFSEPERTQAVTGDVGLLVRPLDLLTLGAAAYNVIDVHSPEAPLRAGVGVAVGSDTTFRVAFDTVFDLSRADETSTSYHAGAEYLFEGLVLRAGFKHLADEGHSYASGGVGFVAPEGGLEAAYVQGLQGGHGADRTFSFSLKIFL